MEFIDVLDAKGNLTGVSKSKLDIHREGFWHRTVHVWCVNSNCEILLQKRSKNMEVFPDVWDISAAGHISKDEDSRTAAIRETKEEISLTISASDLVEIGEITIADVFLNGTYIDNEFNTIYLVTLTGNIPQLVMQPEEVEDLCWVSIKDFRQLVLQKSSKLAPRWKEYELLLAAVKNN